MFRYLIGLIVSAECFFSQTVIWSESFTNGCVSGCLATTYGGWTEIATGMNGLGANQWFVSSAECGNAAGTCGGACGGDPSLHIGANQDSECTCFFCFDPMGDCGAAYDASDIGACSGSCAGGAVITNKRIQSPIINCTGYSNLVLSFNFIHYGQPGADECSVWYYDGVSWNNLGTLPLTSTAFCGGQGYWTNYSINLPISANNNPNVRIGFNWKNNNNMDNTGTDPSVAIDDIVLFAKPQMCYNSAFAAYTGAGCTANCNLTEFSGFSSMCNGSSIACGSCPGTGPVLTQYFTISSGCTATLTASFQRRCNGIGCSVCSNTCNTMHSSNGCCNSGMDANDYLRVGGSIAPVSITTINLSPGYGSSCGTGPSASFSQSGNTITATGASNGGAIIQWVQTGGTLLLEQRANRQDEIVTFTIQIQSGCNCSDVLPVDIYSFWAETNKNVVYLKWLVKNEKDLSHYRIEKSKDGIYFHTLAEISSENSISEKLYMIIDDAPYEGIGYYKLVVVNKEQKDEKYIIRDVLFQHEYSPFLYEINEREIMFRFIENPNSSFELLDLSGKKIIEINPISNTHYTFSREQIASGYYLALYFNGKRYYPYKIMIP